MNFTIQRLIQNKKLNYSEITQKSIWNKASRKINPEYDD
jgi:hypothetical protein